MRILQSLGRRMLLISLSALACSPAQGAPPGFRIPQGISIARMATQARGLECTSNALRSAATVGPEFHGAIFQRLILAQEFAPSIREEVLGRMSCVAISRNPVILESLLGQVNPECGDAREALSICSSAGNLSDTIAAIRAEMSSQIDMPPFSIFGGSASDIPSPRMILSANDLEAAVPKKTGPKIPHIPPRPRPIYIPKPTPGPSNLGHPKPDPRPPDVDHPKPRPPHPANNADPKPTGAGEPTAPEPQPPRAEPQRDRPHPPPPPNTVIDQRRGETPDVLQVKERQFLSRATFKGVPRSPTRSSHLAILVNEFYSLGYDLERKAPAWAAFEIPPIYNPRLFPRPRDFGPEERVKGVPKPSAYEKSGLDRAHVVSSAAMGVISEEAQGSTFVMSNVAPMTPALNRGPWKTLEQRIICYSRFFGGSHCVVGPIYGKNPKTTEAGIAIPAAFFFVAVIGEGSERRTISWIIPQTAKGTDRPDKYVVSLEQVERQSGLQLFPEMDPAEKEVIKKKISDTSWYQQEWPKVRRKLKDQGKI